MQLDDIQYEIFYRVVSHCTICNNKIFAVVNICLTLQTIYRVLLDYSERVKELFSLYCTSDDQIKVRLTS